LNRQIQTKPSSAKQEDEVSIFAYANYNSNVRRLEGRDEIAACKRNLPASVSGRPATSAGAQRATTASSMLGRVHHTSRDGRVTKFRTACAQRSCRYAGYAGPAKCSRGGPCSLKPKRMVPRSSTRPSLTTDLTKNNRYLVVKQGYQAGNGTHHSVPPECSVRRVCVSACPSPACSSPRFARRGSPSYFAGPGSRP